LGGSFERKMEGESMRWAIGGCLTAAVLFLASGSAGAGDRPFAFAYTTDIEEQGETEIEQEITWASGHAREAFQEIQSRTEIETAVTDDLLAAFYLNHTWARTRPQGGSAETSSLPGIAAEFIYRLTDADSDPLGFAVYGEGAVGNGSRAFELKALFQKNLLHDRLRLALNINVEDVWEKNGLGGYDQSSALEFAGGAAWSLTPQWSIAAEFAHERGFDGLILGGSPRYVDNATFAGPTIAYVGEPFSIVLAAQAQLPWAGGPSGSLSNGYLASAERFRIRLRIGTEF
jgi:hypothetical protein